MRVPDSDLCSRFSRDALARFGTHDLPVQWTALRQAVRHLDGEDIAAVFHPDQWADPLDERGSGVRIVRPVRPAGAFRGTVSFQGDHPTLWVWTSEHVLPDPVGSWVGGLARILRVMEDGCVLIGLEQEHITAFVSRRRAR